MAKIQNQQLAFPEPPYKSQFLDSNGFLTAAWQKWYQQLYIRVGGPLTAPTQNINTLPLVNLISTSAPSSVATVYTSPIGQKTVINQFTVTNNDIVNRTINVWFVQAGTTNGPDSLVANALSIPAGQSVNLAQLQSQVLNGGDFIQIQGSAAGVLNVFANGKLTS